MNSTCTAPVAGSGASDLGSAAGSQPWSNNAWSAWDMTSGAAVREAASGARDAQAPDPTSTTTTTTTGQRSVHAAVDATEARIAIDASDAVRRAHALSSVTTPDRLLTQQAAYERGVRMASFDRHIEPGAGGDLGQQRPIIVTSRGMGVDTVVGFGIGLFLLAVVLSGALAMAKHRPASPPGAAVTPPPRSVGRAPAARGTAAAAAQSALAPQT